MEETPTYVRYWRDSPANGGFRENFHDKFSSNSGSNHMDDEIIAHSDETAPGKVLYVDVKEYIGIPSNVTWHVETAENATYLKSTYYKNPEKRIRGGWHIRRMMFRNGSPGPAKIIIFNPKEKYELSYTIV